MISTDSTKRAIHLDSPPSAFLTFKEVIIHEIHIQQNNATCRSFTYKLLSKGLSIFRMHQHSESSTP